ncbi:MAG: DUF692 family protein [Anaerolineae bacterium]
MHIPFALNYSREAAALLTAGAITADRWKCPPWPDLMAEASQTLPVYVHFDLMAGRGQIEATDWDAIAQLMDDTDTPYVNLHLAPELKDFDYRAEPLSEVQRRRVIDQMIGDVAFVVNRFGVERVIVENIPYRGRHERKGRKFVLPAVEPATFAHVLNETGASMLFDIAHATITADTLEMDVQDYIAALPLERMRELHLAGVREYNGDPEDHLEMTDLDWLLFERTLGAIVRGRAAVPWMVSLEYGGLGEKFEWRSESRVIADHASRIRKMLDTVAVPMR